MLLEKLLTRRTDLDREAFVLVYIEEVSVKEAAQMLGASHRATHRRLERARSRLQKHLAQHSAQDSWRL